MMDATKYIGGILAGLVAMAVTAEPAPRPAFDKSAHVGTAWNHANPWFPATRSRTLAWGGPDFAWHKYSDDPVTMWKELARELAPYGLTGLQLEHVLPDTMALDEALAGFEQAGNGFQLMLFLSVLPTGNDNVASEAERFKKFFAAAQPKLAHPNLYRIDGKPAVIIYHTDAMPYSGREWGEIIALVEAEYGSMVWLVDVGSNFSAEKIEEFVPYFDGVSMYAVWNEPMQREIIANAARTMRKYPQKIFEAAVHSTYSVHFKYASIFPDLLEKYLTSWDITVAARPDAVTITNLFDCYENSRTLPSYELDDVMMNIARYQIARWRGVAAPVAPEPEIYVTNFTNALLGADVGFEVTGLPTAHPEREFLFRLQICTSDGKVIEEFPEQRWHLDTLNDYRVMVAADKVMDQRAVHPRLIWRWNDQEHTTELLPPTIIAPGMRPHVLFWSRSLKHLIALDGAPRWSLGGKNAGEVLNFDPERPMVLLQSDMSSADGGTATNGGGRVRILRNGIEIQSFEHRDLKLQELIRLRDPMGAVDYYMIEMENPRGGRYLSAPIWVASQQRAGKTQMNVLRDDGQVQTVQLDANRVPFFLYACDTDAAFYLTDGSGYEHHGFLGPDPGSYCGGSFGRTGYRFEHYWGLHRDGDNPQYKPHYVYDEAVGAPVLEFQGSQYARIMGGTAFNLAATFELQVKPRQLGRRQGILGSGNNQVNITLREDGRVEVTKGGANSAQNGLASSDVVPAQLISVSSLEPGSWSHIAVVYDLKTITLYINGNEEGSVEFQPQRSSDIFNWVTIGSGNQWLFTPVDFFDGKIRNVRIYGRNLESVEFLR